MKKRLLLTLSILAFGLTAMGQTTTETKIADIKKVRVTKYYEDDEMTIPKTRLDDQHILRHYYDSKGNKVLDSEYHYSGFYYHTAYWYDDNNKVIADSTDYKKNYYGYNEDGSLKYKTKFDMNTGLLVDSTYYEYENGNLRHEIIFKSNKETGRYRYTYENNRLTKREYITGQTKNGDEKISRRVEYTYDTNGNLIEKIEYTLSTSVSSLGTIRSAVRNAYAYDSNNRMTEDVYSEAPAASGILGSFTNKKKWVYTYDGNSTFIDKEEYYMWNPDTSSFEIIDYSEYSTAEYNQNKTPQNFKVEQGETITQVKLSFDEPTDNSNINGYRLIVNDKLHETLYASSPIILDKQIKGTHTYRVMAVYDTIAGNVSERLAHKIDLNLPAPSNGRILTQEYSSQWIVTFAFDAPEAKDGITLTGYRYVVEGGNGGAKGTITPADMTKGTFKMYYLSNDVEKNLVTLNLYAVYEEGESDAYSFQIDLRDTNNQIVAHWHNQSAEKFYYDAEIQWEMPQSLTNYYYTSSNTSNTETLVASVENVWNGETYSYQPMYRTIENATEIWNPETMQWENYKIVETTRDGGEMDYRIIRSTKFYDAATNEFVTTEIRTDHYYYDESTSPYTLVHDWTKNFKVENGEEIYLNYVKHSIDGNSKIETVYDIDQTTILSKVESIYNAYGKLTRVNSYDYIGNEFKLISYTTNEYDIDSDLIITSTSYSEKNGEMSMDNVTRYTGSKDYHYIKTPFGLTYKNETLSWSAPSSENVVPTTYKIYANNVFYAETTETSVIIEGLPTGKHNFTVMCTFDGFESSLSTSLNVNFVNKATFEPSTVTPTPYDAELDNSIESLETVTLVFPSTVASITEGVEALLNSRFMSFPTTATIAEDGKTVVFTLPKDLENGFYSLDIPSKMINSTENTYNPALNYSFSVIKPLTTDLPAPTPDPAEGNVAELSVITLTFDRDAYALESLIDVPGHVYAEDPNGNRTDATISHESWDYTQWTLTFANAITTPGAYRVVIPEGTFGDTVASTSGWTGAFTTGKVNPLIFFDYFIVDAAVDSINLDNQIRIDGNSIIIPEGAKVYSAAGYEVNPANLSAGIYVVSLGNQVAKVIIK